MLLQMSVPKKLKLLKFGHFKYDKQFVSASLKVLVPITCQKQSLGGVFLCGLV
jgi:hypothetical protein